jgi:tripartite-type tricarboxylate transporter receptor subunit TctC
MPTKAFGERAMRLSRRDFLQFAGSASALPVMARLAQAQAYPSQPVRIVVGFAAGGPNDVLARLIGQWLSERLAKPFVTENRPGAGGNIGTEAVVKSSADGYTLLLVGPTNMVNATLYDKLNFNFVRDISPVAGIIRVPQIMAVNPTVPAKSVSEFIAYAKANPSKINMGSPGNGTPAHISGELFNMMTGVNLVHVPYRGAAPVVTDLLSGHLQVYFGTMPSSIEYIKDGRLRALAVTTVTRSEMLPGVPTLSEFVPGYEASSVFGIGAPRNTAAEIVEKLNKEINAALDDPKMKARLASLGGTFLHGAPTDFKKLIAEETDKWSKVIKFANIRLS